MNRLLGSITQCLRLSTQSSSWHPFIAHHNLEPHTQHWDWECLQASAVGTSLTAQDPKENLEKPIHHVVISVTSHQHTPHLTIQPSEPVIRLAWYSIHSQGWTHGNSPNSSSWVLRLELGASIPRWDLCYPWSFSPFWSMVYSPHALTLMTENYTLSATITNNSTVNNFHKNLHIPLQLCSLNKLKECQGWLRALAV